MDPPARIPLPADSSTDESAVLTSDINSKIPYRRVCVPPYTKTGFLLSILKPFAANKEGMEGPLWRYMEKKLWAELEETETPEDYDQIDGYDLLADEYTDSDSDDKETSKQK